MQYQRLKNLQKMVNVLYRLFTLKITIKFLFLGKNLRLSLLLTYKKPRMWCQNGNRKTQTLINLYKPDFGHKLIWLPTFEFLISKSFTYQLLYQINYILIYKTCKCACLIVSGKLFRTFGIYLQYFRVIMRQI